MKTIKTRDINEKVYFIHDRGNIRFGYISNIRFNTDRPIVEDDGRLVIYSISKEPSKPGSFYDMSLLKKDIYGASLFDSFEEAIESIRREHANWEAQLKDERN